MVKSRSQKSINAGSESINGYYHQLNKPAGNCLWTLNTYYPTKLRLTAAILSNFVNYLIVKALSGNIARDLLWFKLLSMRLETTV